MAEHDKRNTPDKEEVDGAGRAEMDEFEARDELPSDPREWPDGKAKFVTFADDEDPYGEGKTAKIGPPVTYHEDGSVSVDGEKVDDPDAYKGEPIPLAVDIEEKSRSSS